MVTWGVRTFLSHDKHGSDRSDPTHEKSDMGCQARKSFLERNQPRGAQG